MSEVWDWVMGMREGGIEGELTVSFLTVQWPYARELCLLCLILANLVKHRKLDPEKKLHWVHDFVMTWTNTFAAGFTGALCVGELPAPFTNDKICTWFLILWPIFRFYDKAAVRITTMPIVWQAVHFLATLSRTNQICNYTDKAFNKYSPHARYYPLALLGPIVVGTIRGSGSNFSPQHKGLSCLKGGVPLNTQLAFVGATVWHLLVNDTFVVGAIARGLLLYIGFEPSKVLIKNCIIIAFLFLNVVWTLPGCKTFNPLRPIWSLFNYLLCLDVAEEEHAEKKSKEGTSGDEPVGQLYDYEERYKVQFTYDIFRWCYIGLMFSVFVFKQLPPSSFSLTESLSQGDYLATCSFLPGIRSCEPTIAVLEEGGVLNIYRGGVKPTDTRRNLVWSSTKSTEKDLGTDFKATLDKNGILSIRSGDKEPIWETSYPRDSCATESILKDAQNVAVPIKAVVVNGGLEVRIGDKMTWSSLHN
eukprot:267228_1